MVCLFAAAIPDIDMSGADALKSIVENLRSAGVTFVMVEVMEEVRAELDRYGLVEVIGSEHIFPTLATVEHAFRKRSTH